jgi:hypothetical protein
MTSFSTTLEAVIYTRPAANPPADWQEFDRGPGIFHLPEGQETGARLRIIGDKELRQFINEVKELKSLVMLNLSENRAITDESLPALKDLPRLAILNLSSCSITSTGLVELANLTCLTDLDLSYCNRINDLGLKKLKRLVNLKSLNLQGCVKVSNAGAALLRRPGLIIKK